MIATPSCDSRWRCASGRRSARAPLRRRVLARRQRQPGRRAPSALRRPHCPSRKRTRLEDMSDINRAVHLRELRSRRSSGGGLKHHAKRHTVIRGGSVRSRSCRFDPVGSRRWLQQSGGGGHPRNFPSGPPQADPAAPNSDLRLLRSVVPKVAASSPELATTVQALSLSTGSEPF